MGSQELWEVPIAVPCNELRRHHVFVENAGERSGHAGQRVGFGEFGLDFCSAIAVVASSLVP
jgi:hypothetical protein